MAKHAAPRRRPTAGKRGILPLLLCAAVSIGLIAVCLSLLPARDKIPVGGMQAADSALP